jgi:penicillin amidase
MLAVEGALSSRLTDRPDLRAIDRQLKRMGLFGHAQAQVAQLEGDLRGLLLAYGAGVNAARERRRRPLELRVLGVSLPPFEPYHALGMMLMLGYVGLAEGQRNSEKFIVEALVRGVPEGHLRELFAPYLEGWDAELLRGVQLAGSVATEARPPDPALPRATGSNNWVVAPHRSASGLAMLANDPHLEMNRLPPLVYEAQLVVSDDEWYHGATVPGLPGVLFGRNAHVAWGVTYGVADACDYFVERCDGKGNYLREGAWVPLRARHETVAGRESFTVWESEHGVLEGPAGERAGDYLAWAWTGFARAAESMAAYMRVTTARTAAAARRELDKLAVPALHMVLADDQGGAEYQYAAAIPERRPGWSGLYPVAGWEARNDWRGVLPFARMPHCRVSDTEAGVYATANQAPDSSGITTAGQTPYRRDRILELLAEHDKLTIEDLQRAQYDVVSLQARRLAPVFAAHLGEHGAEGAARRALLAWDGSYGPDLTEPTLFENLYDEAMRAVFCTGTWGEWLAQVLTVTALSYHLFGFFDAILAREDSAWLPAARRGEVLRGACARGAARSAPPWGQVHALTMRHIVFGGRVGELLRLDRRAVPLGGSRATVRQATLFKEGDRENSFGPAYHFVTAPAQPWSHTNMPGGASERPWSRFYASDVAAYLHGGYRRLDPRVRGQRYETLVPF